MAAKKKTTKKAKQKRSQAKTGAKQKTGAPQKAGAKQKAARKGVRKVAPQTKTVKTATRKVKAPKTAGKLSALQAAVRVLAEAGRPLTCREMVDAMTARKYWSSPAGKSYRERRENHAATTGNPLPVGAEGSRCEGRSQRGAYESIIEDS